MILDFTSKLGIVGYNGPGGDFMLFDSFWYLLGSLAIPAIFVILIVRTVRKKNRRVATSMDKGFTPWEKVLLFFCILSLAILAMGFLGLVPKRPPV